MADDHEHQQSDPALRKSDPAARRTRLPGVDDAADLTTTDLASSLGNRGVERVLRATAVQRAGTTSHQELDEAVARSIDERRGAGTPLDGGTRHEMEGALGTDLGDVRIHTDRSADDLNEAVSAKAFTSGSDVFFRQGRYDPTTSSGRELLAHELTHVVQQRSGSSGLAGGEISDPSDQAEVEASEVGAAVAGSSGVPSRAAIGGPGVAREPAEEDELQLAVARQSDEMEEDELQLAVARQSDDMEEDELQLAVARQSDEMEEDELLA